MNIILNALLASASRYAGAGKGKSWGQFSTRVRPGEVRLIVRDNGNGIARQRRPGTFGMYKQAKNGQGRWLGCATNPASRSFESDDDFSGLSLESAAAGRRLPPATARKQVKLLKPSVFFCCLVFVSQIQSCTQPFLNLPFLTRQVPSARW